MDPLYSISKYLGSPCSYFSNLFSEINPYWRSDVVLVGIAATSIGTIISLIQGYTLIALISFVATCILSFAFYYVEAYIHLNQMKEHLNAFNNEVSSLKEQILHFEEIEQSFSIERKRFSEENTTLHEEISRLTQINHLLDGKFTTLTEATNQVHAVMEQMNTARDELKRITDEIYKEGARQAALNQQCIDLQEQIANRFSLYTDSLKQSVSANLSLAPQLSSYIEDLKRITSIFFANRNTPCDRSLIEVF